MDFIICRDASGFEQLRGEWNDLLGRCRCNAIFMTWEWQTTWWRCVGEARGALYLLAVRNEGRLVAIIPLYLTEPDQGGLLQVVGCVEVSDFLDLIIEAGQEDQVYSAFLDWLAGSDAPPWRALSLCNQPEMSLSYTRLPELARSRGWSAEVIQEDVAPAIVLPGLCDEPDCSDGWEAYLESLDKKQRHEIRRKMRRMEREAPDAHMQIVTGGESLDQDLDRFIALHKLSRPEKDRFMTEEMEAFFHAIARSLAERGWLDLVFLQIGDQAVASYLCFDYRNEILVYNSGFDAQASPQLSPGWVLLAEMIEDAISKRRGRFDFLQGNEDYKYRFGGVDHPVYQTVIRRS